MLSSPVMPAAPAGTCYWAIGRNLGWTIAPHPYKVLRAGHPVTLDAAPYQLWHAATRGLTDGQLRIWPHRFRVDIEPLVARLTEAHLWMIWPQPSPSLDQLILVPTSDGLGQDPASPDRFGWVAHPNQLPAVWWVDACTYALWQAADGRRTVHDLLQQAEAEGLGSYQELAAILPQWLWPMTQAGVVWLDWCLR